jgi:hypothetical protein
MDTAQATTSSDANEKEHPLQSGWSFWYVKNRFDRRSY